MSNTASIINTAKDFLSTAALLPQLIVNAGLPSPQIAEQMGKNGWSLSLEVNHQATVTHEPSMSHVKPHIFNPKGQEVDSFDSEYLEAIKATRKLVQ